MNNFDTTSIKPSIATLAAAFPFVSFVYSFVISFVTGLISFIINKLKKPKHIPVPGVKCPKCKEKNKVVYVAIGKRCPDCRTLCL